MSKVWLDHEEHCLSAESLRALFENEIACIRIRGFATAQESEAFVGAMDDVGLSHEYKVLGPNVKHRPRYLGVPQFEYRKRLKADYFATVERAYAEQRAVFERCRFDALERLSQALRVALPGHSVGVAEEPGYGRYFAGIIRDTTGGTNLHMDYARVSASDYSIAANDAQIATNFYASGTDEGGETTVYNLHFVPPAMPPGQVFEISPFREEWIAGCESHTFKPIPGDLVMFIRAARTGCTGTREMTDNGEPVWVHLSGVDLVAIWCCGHEISLALYRDYAARFGKCRCIRSGGGVLS